jgi:hypothetical protein
MYLRLISSPRVRHAFTSTTFSGVIPSKSLFSNAFTNNEHHLLLGAKLPSMVCILCFGFRGSFFLIAATGAGFFCSIVA